MKCSVCGRISATAIHADCAERLRMGVESSDKGAIAERISLDNAELGSEIRAILGRIKERDGA